MIRKSMLNLALAFVVVMFVSSVCFAAEPLGNKPPAKPDINTAAKIDINTASANDLITLNGIGKSYAERIVEYRKANGPFKILEDLMKVNGIGKVTFEKIKDKITVGAVSQPPGR